MTARIRVLDVNDNPPLFAGSSVSSDDVSFSESAPASSFRILPQAQDRDSPSNAVIEYVMTPASDVFELGTPATESDGNLKLYVTGALDREAQDQYQFQVRLSDFRGEGVNDFNLHFKSTGMYCKTPHLKTCPGIRLRRLVSV